MSKKPQKTSSHSRPFYSAEDKLRAVREEQLAVSAVCSMRGFPVKLPTMHCPQPG